MVLYAGRWPSEDAAGIVESVRFVSTRSAHIVDVSPLRRVGGQLFGVPTRARRERMRWFDVAEVRVVGDAEYIPTQDAYRIPSARDGYAKLSPETLASLSEKKRIADEEYAALQRALLIETGWSSLGGTLLVTLLFGRTDIQVSGAYVTGAAAGFLYLLLLQRAVDAMGASSGLIQKLLGFRFLVPVLPFLLIATTKQGVLDVDSFSTLSYFQSFISSISRLDALAIVLGLLTYKVPLLLRTFSEFVDGLSQLEVGKTGMIGTLAGMAARRIKESSSTDSATTPPQSGQSSKRKRVMIFAGPSGAGKSTLMQRLLQEKPELFEYSVSHTTREKRDGEQDGRDYYFVSMEQFDEMIEHGEFVEYATVHGKNKYGTSLAAVSQVKGICLLDLDVQGVDTVRRKQQMQSLDSSEGWNWDARFIWVAPPSIYALEQRLRSRDTESNEVIEKRLRNATKELTYAATSDAFDLILINDDVDRAVGELNDFVERTCREWDREQ